MTLFHVPSKKLNNNSKILSIHSTPVSKISNRNNLSIADGCIIGIFFLEREIINVKFVTVNNRFNSLVQNYRGYHNLSNQNLSKSYFGRFSG